MELKFQKISDFKGGTLLELLEDAYSFDPQWGECFRKDWREFDSFFYDNLEIADKYGFITTLYGRPIGLASWDPRHRPEYIEIGHNCIRTEYKGNGYGERQLAEAIHRISQEDVKKIVVTTSQRLYPAQKMYEGVGFMLCRRRVNNGYTSFSGDYLDYEIIHRGNRNAENQSSK